jgi:hypothetical protein
MEQDMQAKCNAQTAFKADTLPCGRLLLFIRYNEEEEERCYRALQ